MSKSKNTKATAKWPRSWVYRLETPKTRPNGAFSVLWNSRTTKTSLFGLVFVVRHREGGSGWVVVVSVVALSGKEGGWETFGGWLFVGRRSLPALVPFGPISVFLVASDGRCRAVVCSYLPLFCRGCRFGSSRRWTMVVGVVDVETGKVNIEINHVLHQMLYNNCRKRKCESGGELGQIGGLCTIPYSI